MFSKAVDGFSEMSVSDNRLPLYMHCLCIAFPSIVKSQIGVPCKYSFCYGNASPLDHASSPQMVCLSLC